MQLRRSLVIPKRSLLDYSIFLMIFITLAWYNYTPLVIGSQFLALGISILIYRFSLRKHTDYLLWWIIFIVYSFFTSSYTPSTSTILNMMISIIQVAVIGIVIVNYVIDYYSLEWTIKSICIAGIVLCLRLLIEVPHNAWGTERVGNYIGYGNDPAAIVLCFAALFLYIGFKLFDKKSYLLIAFLFCVISIFTGSRKGVLIVIIGMVIMIVWSRKTVPKALFTLAILIVVIVLGYIAVMNVPILYDILGSRIEALFYTLTQGHRDVAYNNSSEERILHMKYAIGFFKTHPIFGLGLDGYRSVCPIRHTYSHCNYTELLADMGAVGFIIYYFYPLMVFKKSIFSFRYSRNIALILGLLCAFLICDLGMVTYMDETIHIYFAVCIGTLSVLSEITKEANEGI